jgi:hypothetical protein
LAILRILWIAVSVLIIQVAALHFLLAVERLRTAWTFLVPCAILALLLWRFHDSTVEVALCTLAAVAAGFLVTTIVYVASFGQVSSPTAAQPGIPPPVRQL